MVRITKTFICQSCGAVTTRWLGQCSSCHEWNSIEESQNTYPNTPKGLGRKNGTVLVMESLSSKLVMPPRIKSNIQEFDRVLGGGVVPGSSILIGGDPGIGKSTLLLQLVTTLSESGRNCVYISGEESTNQVRLRAQRLALTHAPVHLLSATSIRDITSTIQQQIQENKVPALVIIDSIQTMFIDTIESTPGTVSQVRTCAQELTSFAKLHGIAIILVGHVTKDGQIAGPRVLEHMVDALLYFEGDRGNQFRILRSVKNRFGASNEIGVFEMNHSGLAEVTNPSALFLGTRDSTISGTAVFAGMEGSRPVLVEIEALIAPSTMANPRRAIVGWDASRLAMIIAVLETRCRISVSGMEVYLNVAGGLRIQEPAADLAVAAALISSLTDTPLPKNTILFGEIALSGEIRPTGHADSRLREAQKLGFTSALLPKASQVENTHLSLKRLTTLSNLIKFFEELSPEPIF